MTNFFLESCSRESSTAASSSTTTTSPSVTAAGPSTASTSDPIDETDYGSFDFTYFDLGANEGVNEDDDSTETGKGKGRADGSASER